MEGNPAVLDPVQLTTISVKLPTFWTDSPEVWFIQAEAQFENKRITASRTKFTHCVAALPQDVACRLLDLVRSPPAEPYEALRRRLIQMYTLSDFQRYQALQSLPLLSDQRPSELMDKMLMLLPEDEKPGFFFRGLFMDRLPADVRSHLLTESISDPRRMALRADELWTIRGKSSAVHAISDECLQEVNALQRKASSGGRKSKPTASSNPSRGSSECWYHRRWGDEATQCRAPCSYSGN